MESEKRFEPDPFSALGDFYRENRCCTVCGVPQVAAPDLIGWIEAEYTECYWKKQPQTPGEMEQAFAIFQAQELGCFRYAGRDPKIQARIGSGDCDFPIEGVVFVPSREWNAAPLFDTRIHVGLLQRFWAWILRQQ